MFRKITPNLETRKLKNLLLTTLLATTATYAQVGVGTTTPDGSAALEIQSTSKGLLLPRMTNAQMESISSPAEGLVVYCTDCTPKGMYYYDGTNFISSGVGVPSGLDATTEVYSRTGKIWMNKNLGATQIATSLTDHLAYGSSFQWGRSDDGHELVNWTSSTTTDGAEQLRETATTSATDSPGHDDFITSSGDWRTTGNNSLWQGVAGVNNPCPSGFRIPTATEWIAERNTWSASNGAGANASVLKLPYAGIRVNSTGGFTQQGTISGNYWSSSINSQNAQYMAITDSFATVFNIARGYGLSVRCIKD